MTTYLLVLYVFLFSCIPADECGRVNNKLPIRYSDLLFTKEALAENSNCNGPNDVCCHEDDILYFYPEDKTCSAIDGYTCASPINCKVTYINENNLASCSDVDIRILSGSSGMICCANQDIKVPPKPCSSFDGRRCVPENQCGGNKVAQVGLFGLENTAVDEAFCSKESEICCSEDEITQKYPEDKICSEIDGYRCASPINCQVTYDILLSYDFGFGLQNIFSTHLSGNNLASCSDFDSTSNDVCCHRDDLLFKYPEDILCSEINGYRCTSPINCNVTEISENNLASCSDVDSTSNDVCCHRDDLFLKYPEDILCSAIDGYTCASPIDCKVTEINENNLAGCEDVDIKIWSGSTGMICCANKDIKLSPKPCSSFDGRR